MECRHLWVAEVNVARIRRSLCEREGMLRLWLTILQTSFVLDLACPSWSLPSVWL